MIDENGRYIIGEQWGQCQFCKELTDVRVDYCFHCADAQSIIGTGLDMYDLTIDGVAKISQKDSDGARIPVEETNRRLQLLIKNGWIHSSNIINKSKDDDD